MIKELLPLYILAGALLILIIPQRISLTVEMGRKVRIRVYFLGVLRVFSKTATFEELTSKPPDMSFMSIVKAIKLKRVNLNLYQSFIQTNRVILTQFADVLINTVGQFVKNKLRYSVVYTYQQNYAYLCVSASFVPIVIIQKLLERGLKNARATNTRNS